MSASWDENRDGDLLGTDEFQRNLDSIKDGLSRSRGNALLRERMAGLSDAEIKRALQELEKKEGAESRRTQSLQAKLEEDLE
jgi:Photosynthesis affected mutant 68